MPPKDDQWEATEATWKRRLLAVYLDFILYGTLYGLFVRPLVPDTRLELAGFVLLQFLVLRARTRQYSPGRFLLSIHPAGYGAGPKGQASSVRRSPRVETSVQDNEHWLTLFLGVFFLLGGLKSLFRALDSPIPAPLFGMLPGPTFHFAFWFLSAAASLYAGYAYFKLKPLASFFSAAVILITAVAQATSLDLWPAFLEAVITARRQSRGATVTTAEIETLQAVAPILFFAAMAILAVAVLYAGRRLALASNHIHVPGGAVRSAAPIHGIAFALLLALSLGKFILMAPAEARLAYGTAWDMREMIDDDAAVLSGAQRRFVAAYHRRLLQHHDIDYRIVTTAGPVEINSFSAQLFHRRSIGKLSRSGRGLLLVLDPASDTVRLEVSASLEGVYPDAFAAYLQQRQMVYFFRSGRIADGIVAATELIVARAQEAEAGHAFDPEGMPGVTTGAGAVSQARLATGDLPDYRDESADVAAAWAPLQTVEAYLGAMARRDARPDLDIYSAETRKMLARWTVTPAQMDNIAATYRQCPPPEPMQQAGHAVVRYPVEARQCSPWFLLREEERWRLDLTAMQTQIGFNHNNQWHFRNAMAPTYRFAFADWHIDRHGFPHPVRILKTEDRGQRTESGD